MFQVFSASYSPLSFWEQSDWSMTHSSVAASFKETFAEWPCSLLGGKNRELLLIDFTVDPTNSAQFHFLSSDTHLARRSCWTPLLVIDSLILEENSTLSNCSRQNVTTSFRAWPLLGEKSQEWVGEWWARLWKSKLGTSGNRRAFEDLGTV